MIQGLGNSRYQIIRATKIFYNEDNELMKIFIIDKKGQAKLVSVKPKKKLQRKSWQTNPNSKLKIITN